VVKAQTNKVRLARLKGELVDRPQAIAHVFKLARSERDAWLNWPARISAQMAAKLGVDPHTMHVALEAAVREHLQELGDCAPGGLMDDGDTKALPNRARVARRADARSAAHGVRMVGSHRMLSSKASAEPGAGAPAARRT
jgi:hypothetical protein